MKVPACLECNNKKSKLEHYLASLLPFGGLHRDAKEHLSVLVPKRLEKNHRLKDELASGMICVDVNNGDGEPENRLAIPFDGKCYADLFELVSRALVWHHWRMYIGKDTFTYSTSLTSRGSQVFEEYFFALQNKNRVDETIGAGTVKYTGVQGLYDDQLTVWQFQIFNGLTVADGVGAGAVTSSSVGVITAPAAQSESILRLFGG